MSSDGEAISRNWYKNEKEGWYRFEVPRSASDPDEWIDYYQTIVEWITTNVERSERHARWIIDPNRAVFKFRYERDYLRFILRWT